MTRRITPYARGVSASRSRYSRRVGRSQARNLVDVARTPRVATPSYCALGASVFRPDNGICIRWTPPKRSERRGETMPSDAPESREATHGSRMIELPARFWTNDLGDHKGAVRPKHAWTAGVVRMAPNASHGTGVQNPRPFNSLGDLLEVIEKVLIENKITLHPSRKMQRFIDA